MELIPDFTSLGLRAFVNPKFRGDPHDMTTNMLRLELNAKKAELKQVEVSIYYENKRQTVKQR